MEQAAGQVDHGEGDLKTGTLDGEVLEGWLASLGEGHSEARGVPSEVPVDQAALDQGG